MPYNNYYDYDTTDGYDGGSQGPTPPGWHWDPERGEWVRDEVVAGPSSTTDEGNVPGNPLVEPESPRSAITPWDGGDFDRPMPQYTPTEYSAPGPFSYQDFSYQDWKAPSVDEILADPSLRFRQEQGEGALQRWAAARGTLNDSGTAKALIDYGQNSAAQEYQNVWNRNFNTYNTNRRNAFDTYSVNRQGALDAYNTNYRTQYVDPYTNRSAMERDRYAAERESYAAAYQNFKDRYDRWRDLNVTIPTSLATA